MGNPTTKDDVIKAVKDNHIWINAFQLVNPTDEMIMDIGNMVIDKLKNKENLLPMYLEEQDSNVAETMQSLAELTPHLYISVNAS